MTLRPLLAAVLLFASATALAQAPAQAPPSQAARDRWDNLSPAEKDVLRQRWRTFQEMTPERQAELRARLEY